MFLVTMTPTVSPSLRPRIIPPFFCGTPRLWRNTPYFALIGKSAHPRKNLLRTNPLLNPLGRLTFPTVFPGVAVPLHAPRPFRHLTALPPRPKLLSSPFPSTQNPPSAKKPPPPLSPHTPTRKGPRPTSPPTLRPKCLSYPHAYASSTVLLTLVPPTLRMRPTLRRIQVFNETKPPNPPSSTTTNVLMRNISSTLKGQIPALLDVPALTSLVTTEFSLPLPQPLGMRWEYLLPHFSLATPVSCSLSNSPLYLFSTAPQLPLPSPSAPQTLSLLCLPLRCTLSVLARLYESSTPHTIPPHFPPGPPEATSTLGRPTNSPPPPTA